MKRVSAKRSSGWQRLRRWRSPVIAMLALAILIWSAVATWEIDPAELWGYLLVIVVGLVFIVALAFVASLLLRWLRSSGGRR